jgi:hypothetical protein
MDFTPTLTTRQKLAAIYGVFVGFMYFAAGYFGLDISGQLLAVVLYDFLIVPPLPALEVFRACTKSFPCYANKIPYDGFPSLHSSSDWRAVSMVSMYLGVILIVSAGLMLARKRIGLAIWCSFAILSVVTTIWSVFKGLLLMSNPSAAVGRGGIWPTSIFWSASYVIAYLVMRKSSRPARNDQQPSGGTST